MRELIIEATSLIEALIDFGEDAEIDEGVFQLGEFSPSSYLFPLSLCGFFFLTDCVRVNQ